MNLDEDHAEAADDLNAQGDEGMNSDHDEDHAQAADDLNAQGDDGINSDHDEDSVEDDGNGSEDDNADDDHASSHSDSYESVEDEVYEPPPPGVEDDSEDNDDDINMAMVEKKRPTKQTPRRKAVKKDAPIQDSESKEVDEEKAMMSFEEEGYTYLPEELRTPPSSDDDENVRPVLPKFNEQASFGHVY
ncbi:uncharacterized protein LOC133301648 [Gastrolobium bilobum]|uniref:uncharacterized protein LOC133301648 n=1 Tax=Gastrolobium bilobum TaxID=150636 RepID=UPI002AB127B9|nr:uncharacterized protein LOC133301648 [Gastrolobium bilobum]